MITAHRFGKGEQQKNHRTRNEDVAQITDITNLR